MIFKATATENKFLYFIKNCAVFLEKNRGADGYQIALKEFSAYSTLW